ncbi:hypothetical protein GCM10010442_41660 [Kitasatospora kifunensis]
MDQAQTGETDGAHGRHHLMGAALGGDDKQMRLHGTLFNTVMAGFGTRRRRFPKRVCEREARRCGSSVPPVDQRRINTGLLRRSERWNKKTGRC